MDRVSVFGTDGGGSIPPESAFKKFFIALFLKFEGPVAQLAEHLPLKEVVESSILSGLTLQHIKSSYL